MAVKKLSRPRYDPQTTQLLGINDFKGDNGVETEMADDDYTSYDVFGRVTGHQHRHKTWNGVAWVWPAEPDTRSWIFDGAANETCNSKDTGTECTAPSREFDLRNEIEAMEGDPEAEVLYDEAGRLLHLKHARHTIDVYYFYDAWNRLAGYGDSADAADAVFEYDAMGHLIKQGPSKHLYYDAQGNLAWVAAMPAGADSINVWSIYSGRLLAILEGTATNWHVSDARGRPALTTDLAGTPKERYWGTPDGNNDPPGGDGPGGAGGGIGGFPAASTAGDSDSGMPVAWTPLGYEPQYLPVWTGGQFLDTGAGIMGGAEGAWFSTVAGAPVVPPQVTAATAAEVTVGPVASGETGGKVSVACPNGIWRRTVLVYDADNDRLRGYTIDRMLDFDAADTPVLVPFGKFLGHEDDRGTRDSADWLAWFTNLPCTCVERMEIYGHGDPGEQNLGSDRHINKDNVGTQLGKVNWCEPCSILLAGCDVGYGDEGTGLGVAAATSTGCSVEAWTGDFMVGRLVSLHFGRKRTWNPDGTERGDRDPTLPGAHIAGIP